MLLLILPITLSTSTLVYPRYKYYTGSCPKINTVDNFNLTEYVNGKWYIQKQQETSYLPLNSNYCVTAEYEISHRKIPFYHGNVISVFNYANLGKVNGKTMESGNTLCARIPNSSIPSKLLVAPCFLPNIFAGDYWVVDAGPQSDDYQWAIISGGQPTEKYSDGCTTKIKGINGSGLWFFTRMQNPNNTLLDFISEKAKNLGFTLQKLNNVEQKGCLYN
jgi:lipocalin